MTPWWPPARAGLRRPATCTQPPRRCRPSPRRRCRASLRQWSTPAGQRAGDGRSARARAPWSGARRPRGRRARSSLRCAGYQRRCCPRLWAHLHVTAHGRRLASVHEAHVGAGDVRRGECRGLDLEVAASIATHVQPGVGRAAAQIDLAWLAQEPGRCGEGRSARVDAHAKRRQSRRLAKHSSLLARDQASNGPSFKHPHLSGARRESRTGDVERQPSERPTHRRREEMTRRAGPAGARLPAAPTSRRAPAGSRGQSMPP